VTTLADCPARSFDVKAEAVKDFVDWKDTFMKETSR